MVSPNRQGHIVATPQKRSGYGRYRNMTPRGHPTSALESPATNQHCKVDSATEDHRESEPGSGARSREHPNGHLAPPTGNQTPIQKRLCAEADASSRLNGHLENQQYSEFARYIV